MRAVFWWVQAKLIAHECFEASLHRTEVGGRNTVRYRWRSETEHADPLGREADATRRRELRKNSRNGEYPNRRVFG